MDQRDQQAAAAERDALVGFVHEQVLVGDRRARWRASATPWPRRAHRRTADATRATNCFSSSGQSDVRRVPVPFRELEPLAIRSSRRGWWPRARRRSARAASTGSRFSASSSHGTDLRRADFRRIAPAWIDGGSGGRGPWSGRCVSGCDGATPIVSDSGPLRSAATKRIRARRSREPPSRQPRRKRDDRLDLVGRRAASGAWPTPGNSITRGLGPRAAICAARGRRQQIRLGAAQHQRRARGSRPRSARDRAARRLRGRARRCPGS